MRSCFDAAKTDHLNLTLERSHNVSRGLTRDRKESQVKILPVEDDLDQLDRSSYAAGLLAWRRDAQG
jgi:hypothetical protein